MSIPAWFTVDTRLENLSVHLDTPQCFSAEMYSADLGIIGKPEDDKVHVSHIYTHFFYTSADRLSVRMLFYILISIS